MCEKEINRENIETLLGIWLYNRGFLGLIILAFDFSLNKSEKVYKKIYLEIFSKYGKRYGLEVGNN